MNRLILSFAVTFMCFASAHEDHSSRHGGFVMMFLELHLELVLPKEGGVEIFYSDEMRRDIPASVIPDVTVAVQRSNGYEEKIEMSLSDQGDRWTGPSSPIIDPTTIVRVEFFWQGDLITLDVPASVMPRFVKAHDMTKMSARVP